MTEADQSSWSEFHKGALGRPPRELLVRTLSFFDVERRAPGVTVGLVCGSGPDALELLRRGWTVHAVDAEPAGLDMLARAAPTEQHSRLQLHATRIEAFDIENGYRVSGQVTRWHAYGFAARKRAPGASTPRTGAK